MLRRQSRNRSGDPSTPLKEPRLSKRNQAEKSRVRKRRAAKDISLPLLPSICRTAMLSPRLHCAGSAPRRAKPGRSSSGFQSAIRVVKRGMRGFTAQFQDLNIKKGARRLGLFQWAR
jgi:hypothetical protein